MSPYLWLWQTRLLGTVFIPTFNTGECTLLQITQLVSHLASNGKIQQTYDRNHCIFIKATTFGHGEIIESLQTPKGSKMIKLKDFQKKF